jgi:tRNA threonylcarbamoyladenosine biosynthesis protein TsaB
MLVLTIRTDNPEAELGLYKDEQRLAYLTWQAHHALAETIHTQIKELLNSQEKSFKDIGGIVAYQGPGSFTGLRIGLSTANATADSLGITVAGASGEDWINQGIRQLLNGRGQAQIVPNYGAEPNITKPRK